VSVAVVNDRLPAWARTEAFRETAARYRLVVQDVERATNPRRRERLEAELDYLRLRLAALKKGR